MKRIIVALFLVGCSNQLGPQGEEGPQGIPGPRGAAGFCDRAPLALETVQSQTDVGTGDETVVNALCEEGLEAVSGGCRWEKNSSPTGTYKIEVTTGLETRSGWQCRATGSTKIIAFAYCSDLTQ